MLVAQSQESNVLSSSTDFGLRFFFPNARLVFPRSASKKKNLLVFELRWHNGVIGDKRNV